MKTLNLHGLIIITAYATEKNRPLEMAFHSIMRLLCAAFRFNNRRPIFTDWVVNMAEKNVISPSLMKFTHKMADDGFLEVGADVKLTEMGRLTSYLLATRCSDNVTQIKYILKRFGGLGWEDLMHAAVLVSGAEIDCSYGAKELADQIMENKLCVS